MTVQASGGRRSRGRSGGGAEARRAARTNTAVQFLGAMERKLSPLEILSEEGLEIIEHNAETILEEVGIEFRDDPEARAMLKEAGADVQGELVRFPRGMCRELCKTVPSSYRYHGRDPARTVTVGGKNTVYAPVYGPPFYRDYVTERRYATIEDFRNMVKLAYMLPALHSSGGTICEPVDVPVNKRHLDMVYTHLRYSTKPIMGSVTAPERAQDSVDLCSIVFGEQFVQENTVMTSLINANSPMTFDDTMLGALKVYAKNNQACIVSPFIIGGAMSPVTPAGVMAQALAEGMAGIAFSQLVRPGAPVVFGTFASSMSMQTGAPTFGMPEPALIIYGMAQLVRRLNIPFRSGGSLCASKLPDAQAAYESANTILPTTLAGVNFSLHAAGWLEGGLVSCPEKMIMDADQLAALHIQMGGVDLTENGQAMSAIRECGPGQHFLGCEHTKQNFETAYYRSTVGDSNSFEQWESEGSKDTFARAHDVMNKMLADYVAPEIDPTIDEALLAFIAKRKESMPDAMY
ncbi:trimethylamine methyltransferase family protein [Alphaproteobacteria bacterium]|jgi:trimethylamine---corrinoid protein Co-methyltransferase|nr:trimethylamine methyltransferase family protein [Alphaproteobacteria bacterium]